MLVARFSALGDVAMTIPVVYAVCRSNPATRFIMITQQVASSLFVNAPENLVVIGVDVYKKYHGPWGLLKLFMELRRDYQIDAFADLHSVIRTHILAIYSRIFGIPVKRIRKGRAEKKQLTRIEGKQLRQLTPTHQRYAAVFHRFGMKMEDRFVSLFENPVDQSVFSDISQPKQPGETWIAVAPFAKHKGKIYPTDKMLKVVESLAARKATRIFLFGGGGNEQAMLRQWAERFPNVMSMAEKRHGFPKELAMLSCMDVMLSMDSANMHLASLVRLPVVSVWGATHPYCGFTGWKQDPSNILQIDLPCRPCSVFGNRPCYRGDYACLNGIAPDEIIRKIEKVIAARNSNHNDNE